MIGLKMRGDWRRAALLLLVVGAALAAVFAGGVQASGAPASVPVPQGDAVVLTGSYSCSILILYGPPVTRRPFGDPRTRVRSRSAGFDSRARAVSRHQPLGNRGDHSRRAGLPGAGHRRHLGWTVVPDDAGQSGKRCRRRLRRRDPRGLQPLCRRPRGGGRRTRVRRITRAGACGCSHPGGAGWIQLRLRRSGGRRGPCHRRARPRRAGAAAGVEPVNPRADFLTVERGGG